MSGVGEHERVVVDVDDAALRRHRLRHLVGVVGGGQAGPDVEELPHPGLAGQVAHRSREVGATQPRILGELRLTDENLLADRAVDGEVVLAAQQEVPDPRGVRDRGVQLRELLLVVRHARFLFRFLFGRNDAD
jgi:hypothetical protein